jgi:hypothetical protein
MEEEADAMDVRVLVEMIDAACIEGAGAADDARAEAYESYSDNQAKSFQSYANSFRDESVVQDNDSNTYTTLSNEDAEAAVSADPQRYQYVPTPNLVKGVDY